MLLLIKTSSQSKQVTGLEELFSVAEWFFYFALIVSVKKMVTTNINLVATKKGFLGFKGQLILGAMYTFSGVSRMGAVVAFFTGPLGLFDIYQGFKPFPAFTNALRAAYVPLDVSDGSTLDSMYGLTVADVTYFGLDVYYTAFLIFLGVHFFLVLGLKQLFVPAFNKSPRWSEKILHVFHSFAYMDNFQDFDDSADVVAKAELKKRYNDLKKERIMMVILFLIENTLLTLPLAATSFKLTAFYEKLGTITKLSDKEMGALSMCRDLKWIPLGIAALTAVYIPLSIAFYHFGHPWKIIVQEFREEDGEYDGTNVCQQLDARDLRGEERALIREMEEEENEVHPREGDEDQAGNTAAQENFEMGNRRRAVHNGDDQVPEEHSLGDEMPAPPVDAERGDEVGSM